MAAGSAVSEVDDRAPEPGTPEPGAREAILGSLRDTYRRDEVAQTEAEATLNARLDANAPNLIPARGQLEREGRVGLFIELATAVMAEVRRLAGMREVPAATAAYLREHNLPQKVVIAPEPFLDRCDWDSQPLLRLRRGTAADADAVGVTIAPAGAAETGTLVLASSEDRPQLLAFMPETSIVVLPAAWIEPAYEQALARVRTLSGGMPRAVNFITGPSRTGDIAQKLELGAHGPKRLLILVVDDIGQ